MYTLFDSRDLISFGAYMISKEREDFIKNHPEIEEEFKSECLTSVTKFDFANWISLYKKAEEELENSLKEDKIEENNLTVENE